MFLRIYARPKALKLRGTVTLDYNRREAAPGSRCMHLVLGRGAQLPSQEVSGVDATEHHILGVHPAALYWVGL
jgi:hypothetical protein